mmetsp:Transcript_12862/g.30865  ORF Transcript_12862/g.30865 Transcript_12862/m.30865 type:complete len:365 (-) Transcript_12862:106-1200(-)
MGFEVVDDLAPPDISGCTELQLLHLALQPVLLLIQLLNLLLVVVTELHQIGLGVLLRQELLNHLIDVADPSSLLDAPESVLVVLHPLLFILCLLMSQSPTDISHRSGGLQSLLTALVKILLGFEHALTLLQALIHLDTLLHQRLLLLHFLISLVSLFHHPLLEAMELCLRHLLGVIRVVRQQQQLLVVVLLGFQRALNRLQLIVKTNTLLFQALHNLFIGLANAHRLVVLDHRLVQPILKDTDLPHLRGIFRVGQLGIHLQLFVLGLKVFGERVFLFDIIDKCIQLGLHVQNLRHFFFDLFLCRRRLFEPELGDLLSQRLVLVLHLLDNFLVLTNVGLGGLVGGFSLTFQELEPALQILEHLLL